MALHASVFKSGARVFCDDEGRHRRRRHDSNKKDRRRSRGAGPFKLGNAVRSDRQASADAFFS
jgi:hypothetical protein